MKMKRMRFAIVAVFLAVFVFSLAGEGMAGGKMEFTVNNTTSRKIIVAGTYNSGASITTRGWYGVDAGKSRTITFDDFYGTDWFGYYAKNVPNEGEKQKVWSSDGSSHFYGKLPILPEKDFINMIALGGDNSRILSGSVEVGFHKLNFKKNEEYESTDTATLTFE
jgi:hypothetical protein